MRGRFQLVDPSKLTAHEKNARIHSAAQIADIAASITEFGFVKPIVVDEHGVILAGHGAHAAALQLKLEEVPVVRKIGLTEQQKRAYLIVDNRLAEMSTWDRDALVAELKDLRGLDLDGYRADALFAGDKELQRALGDALGAGNDEPAPFLRYSAEQVIEAAFEFYRREGFRYKHVEQHVAMQELNRLAALEGPGLLTSTLCYDVADSYHPQRFSVRIAGKRSPTESFGRDKALRRALKLQLENAGRIGSGYLSPISLVLNTQAAANFRPAFAKYIYRRYAEEGSTILDTSTGYGGRMLGFVGAFAEGRYIGIDPNIDTCAQNVKMAHDLGFGDRVEICNTPAEDVDDVGRRVDLCFTSPPYFSKEHYSDEPTQSWVRYPTIERWFEGFLRPTMLLQHRSLVDGGAAVVNIADVKIGGTLHPLVELTKQAARDVGFQLEEELRFDISRRFGANFEEVTDFEPVLVFRK